MKIGQRGLLIGELAKEVAVKTDTIRFYERNGLLPKPQRLASGYRVYNEAALKQLRFIKRGQSLGFTLDEIKRILSLRGQGSQTCRCVLAMAEATLSETREKLDQLQKFHGALAKNLERWKRSTKDGRKMAADFCALIESSTDSLAQSVG